MLGGSPQKHSFGEKFVGGERTLRPRLQAILGEVIFLGTLGADRTRLLQLARHRSKLRVLEATVGRTTVQAATNIITYDNTETTSRWTRPRPRVWENRCVARVKLEWATHTNIFSLQDPT